MAFTVTFYNVTDNPKKVDKILGTAKATVSCSPFEYVSDLHGSIMLDYTSGIEQSNYATVSEGNGGRTLYCFVRDTIKGTGNHCRVELDIDPLTTNATQLKQCSCICEQTASSYDTYIENGNYKTYQYAIVSNERGELGEGDNSNLSLEFEGDYVIVATIG